MALETYWICTQHITNPDVHCGARGTSDGSAARHTEREPKHSTLTTTRRELADRLAWTDPSTADTSTWCQDDKHERCRGADGCVCGCHARDEAA